MGSQPEQSDADIIVVGAGLAGVTAAAVLGRRWRLILIDPRPTCPPVFKAEKIEPDQAEWLRRLGLFEKLLPHASPIREIKAYYRRRLVSVIPTEQYGVHYSVMVNAIRAAIPHNVQCRLGRVTHITNSADIQRINLDTGEMLTCRLLVLACGPNTEVVNNIGLRKVRIQKEQSFAVGFSIAPANGVPLAFDALTYAVRSFRSGIDYASFFSIGRTKRANVFAFPGEDVSWLQRLLRDPNRELPRCLPALRQIAGECKITGKVETARSDLYCTEGNPQPGVVPIGDAFQNSCPSTGKGLSKIFTDVAVLAEYIPQWFDTAGMSSDKIGGFLGDPRKAAIDKVALQNAAYRRNACLEQSFKWKVHRTKLHVSALLGRA